MLLHRVNTPQNCACRTGEANCTTDELHGYQPTPRASWAILLNSPTLGRDLYKAAPTGADPSSLDPLP